MEAFIRTKRINAKPMTRLEYNKFRGWELPSDENGSDEGMLVEYVDEGKPNTDEFKGYVSWSPLDVFNRAYTPIRGMTFGEAIQAMKEGQKVCRAGWNSKGMFIYYVEANKYPANGNKKGTMVGVFEDDMVPYQAYIAMKTANNTVVPWLASQSDMLDTSWEVID